MAPRFTDSTLARLWRLSATGGTDHDRDQLAQDVVTLYDQFREPMLRYLSGFGLAAQDGEEVLQEVFLSLFQHLSRGKPRQNLRGWLFRVAHNLALKRRSKMRRDLELSEESNDAESVPDPRPNPEDRLVTCQTQRHVLAVVRALPTLDRRCLFLRAEGLRYREIAAILDISLGAVALSLTRALERISRASER
jgi:RNA polymerase sigma-70 factor (ECF subfamily)